MSQVESMGRLANATQVIVRWLSFVTGPTEVRTVRSDLIAIQTIMATLLLMAASPTIVLAQESSCGPPCYSIAFPGSQSSTHAMQNDELSVRLTRGAFIGGLIGLGLALLSGTGLSDGDKVAFVVGSAAIGVVVALLTRRPQ